MPPRQRRKSGDNVAPSSSQDVPELNATSKAVIKLLHWDELPHWQRDNQHILSGYRPASFSFLKSFQSWTYVHNETVNIYTHLLPCFVTVPASLYLYSSLSSRYETATHADVVALSCYFAGAAFCLGMSATFHTISNHSPLVARIGNAFDYVGIVGLITGSFIPSVYYGFFCSRRLQVIYWTMISVIGLGCSAVTVIPRFRKPEWRPFRAGMFILMGLSAVFPVCHGVLTYGYLQMRLQIGLDWVLLQGFLYILGAVIYAARVPEKLWPGKFDILGSSHQIFHTLVVFAAISHLMGLLNAFDYRHNFNGGICSE